MEFLKLHELMRPTHLHLIMRFTIIFVVIFVATKFGQYVIIEWQTSPALLWPTTGIAVAIMWLYGYRYAVPIYLGSLAGTLTGPNAHILLAVITTPLGHVAGQMLGVYLLNYFKFEGVFNNLRNVLVFFISIVVLSVIAPAVMTTVGYMTGNLDGSFYTVFSRRWAGFAFSCLILTPFILAWTCKDPYPHVTSVIETSFVGASLTIVTYMLFWTNFPAEYGFVMFAVFFVVVIWVCLRFSSRIVTLSALFITVLGISGLFISSATSGVLSSQLFAAELFLFIVVPIMYVYSALVKEREKNTEELKLALARIELENVNKTNFISVLAHELRNPLAPIKSTLEIMKLQPMPPEIGQLVTSAYNQVHVMRRLLDDLLDVTRVTQGKFNLKNENVQLELLLRNVIEVTKDTISDREHTLILEKDAPDTVVINVDPIRLEQVLVNVINNAAKFTKRGGHITVAYAVSGRNLLLTVTDNGKGIESENLERIFDSFWQINHMSRQSASGIGVGLALSRQIVELHNGTIRAESKGLGLGSTFIITIPCVTTGQVVLPAKAERVTPILKRTVLVVDDNKAAADALAKLLKIKGHTTHTAYTGKEALQKVVVKAPEVVLLDIGMADMSGYEVAKLLRERGFAGALIAVSGYGQQEDKRKALEVGFDAHFTKPLAIDNLETYLNTWRE